MLGVNLLLGTGWMAPITMNSSIIEVYRSFPIKRGGPRSKPMTRPNATGVSS